MADQGQDDWVQGADDWADPDGGASLATPSTDSLGSKLWNGYKSGVAGAWDQIKQDVAGGLPAPKQAPSIKGDINQMLSLGRLPLDAVGGAMSLTGIPQAFGAVNEAAGQGVAKVLPATPQTPDVAKSFSEMLGTAEQLGLPAKGGPIQTVLDKVSPPGTPPAGPKPTTIDGTYSVAGKDPGPVNTLKRIAQGEPAAPNDWQQEGATAAASAPDKAPGQGDVVGIRSKSGPPRRATVDHYFDNGNAVRLRMDDGTVQDLTTADMLRTKTEAPEAAYEAPAPVNTQQLQPDERPTGPLDLDDWVGGQQPAPRRPPATAPLGGDMLNALDHADSLERAALNQSLNLSGGARQDMLTEAARLRRLYGRSDDESTPPNAYRRSPPTKVGTLPIGQEGDYAHPMSAEPAADLGELAKARNDRPDLYAGEYQRPPGEPPVDAYALEDVQRARAPMAKGESIFDSIRKLGGIKPDPGGDIAQITKDFKNPPFVKRLVNPDGMPADDVRRALQEEGWFGRFEDQFGTNAQETGKYPGDDIRDLYDLMDREARGEKVYHPESSTHADLAERAYADREMTEAGIADSDSDEAAAHKLAAYRATRGTEIEADHGQSSHDDFSGLPTEDQERLADYGYEPGADIGAEHEEPESAGAGAEGSEDWLEEPGDNAQDEGGAGDRGEAPAEDDTGEQPSRRPSVEEPEDLFATEPGAVDAQGRALDQTIIPGAEKSAKALAAAREASWHGKIKAKSEQKAPGGLFGEEAPPEPPQRSLFQPEDRFNRPFYSALTRGVEGLKFEKAKPSQWAATIKNLPGVKAEELNWSGIENWLKDQTKSVTKAEVLDHLRENEVQVQEVEKSDHPARLKVNKTARALMDHLVKNEHFDEEGARRYAEDAMRGELSEGQLRLQSPEARDLSNELQEAYENRELGRTANPTKFSTYVLPGGENYRELLLTTPAKDAPVDTNGWTTRPAPAGAWGDNEIVDPHGVVQGYMNGATPEAAIRAYLEGMRRTAKGQDFRSGHWDEPNVLAHVRFDDRTGPNGEKILHMAEVQSDWHQQGRRRGYGTEKPKVIRSVKAADLHVEEGNHSWTVSAPDGRSFSVGKGTVDGEGGAREYGERYLNNEAHRENLEADREASGKVPDAPFKSTWHELAAKRMLRYAAEHGYDRLSWDTGETQADRYDLSKQVSAVEARRNNDGTFDISIKHDGEWQSNPAMVNLKPEGLPDVVGKDLAEKIVNDIKFPGGKSYSGLDLKVGGEGMKGFYDKILPAFFNKYGKKWGAKVEAGKVISDVNAEAKGPEHAYRTTVHSIPITPAMRESVMRGQAMFQPGPMAFPSRAGEFKDLGPEFSDWVQRGKYPNDGIGLSNAVREYLLNRGATTDHEALGLHNTAKNAVTHMETSGLPGSVNYSDDIFRAMSDPTSNLIVHHNHPSSRSFSNSDISSLAYPGVRWMIVHGHDGNWFGAKLSPAWRKGISTAKSPEATDFYVNRLREKWDRTGDVVEPHFIKAVGKGQITTTEANDAWPHTVNTLLANNGLIDYRTSKEFAPHVQSVIDQATHAVSGVYRPSNPILYDRGIGEIHSELQGRSAPADAGRGEEGSEVSGKKPKVDQPDGIDREQPFGGMTREEFLGAPKITTNANGTRLRPRAYKFLDDVKKEPFAVGNLTAKYSPDGAAVFDGDKPIASYNFGNTLVVDPKYRSKGIAQELVYQWRSRYPGPANTDARTKAAQAIQEKVWNRITAKVEQPEDRFPVNPGEAADRRDSAADDMAETLRTSAPGTYSRTLHRMAPPSGDLIFKDPNAVQNFTIRPETLARLDTRSATKWNAEKAKDAEANTMVDDLRSRIANTMLKLPDTSRDKVYAARELDRINGLVRSDTGHAIVARNDGASFAHFSKPGQVVTLNPQETAAYHALSDMFDRAWKNIMEGAARKVGWTGAWDKEDMDVNLRALNHVAENSADDKGRARVAQRAAAITSNLDAQRRQGYHPLMRFGDYFAHVTPKIGTDMESTGGFPKTAWFELAERGLGDEMVGGSRKGNQSPEYAESMLERLKEKFPADQFNVEHGFLSKNPDMLDRVDIPAIEKLMTFMENDMLHGLRVEARGRGMSKADAKDYATKKYDDLYGRLVDQLWEKAFQELQSGYRKKSSTVPGYSPDFDRSLGTYMHWTSRNVADQIHRTAIDEADTALQTDPRVNRDVKRYWKAWTDYQRSPSNVFNKSVNGLARWGFLTSMGVNPSSTVVVGTHGLFMAGPTLSVGLGMKKAAPAYAKAMNHAMGAVKVGRDGLSIPDATVAARTPGEKAFLQRLDSEGILHSRAIEDMAALNEKQSSLWGSARSKARKFMDVALSNVSVMDRANRIASALSAYRLAGDPATLAKMDQAWRVNQIWRDQAEKRGVSQESMASFMVPNMVGEYGKANQAPIERNAVTRMMMGMHGFVTRLLSKMWQMGSMSPEGRQGLLWVMGAFWLMAGLDGEPFAEDVQNGADLIWKTATGKDPMLGYRIQAGLASMFGKAGASLILHGPASALSGADVASRLGMGDLITRNWPTAENTLGAYPSIILGRVRAAVQDIHRGEYGQAATEALPAGVRNAAKAVIEREKGVRTGAGKVTVPASRLTPSDTAARALGFTPEKAEEAYERQDYRYRASHAKMRPPPNPIPPTGYAKGGRVNANPTPSDAQIEAGNYKHGHLRLHGFDISIETPKGVARRGVGADGKEWENRHPTAHYGYLKGTVGADSEHVDAYVGPHHDSRRIYIVDQFDPKTRRWDEHKLVFGARTIKEAKIIYDHGFSDGSGPRRRRHVHQVSPEELKDWLSSSETGRPFAEAIAA